MQTKLICAGAALLGIASYLAYLNYHYVLTGSIFIAGIAVTIFAIVGKDKKDKQIQEIHTMTTNNNKIDHLKEAIKAHKDKGTPKYYIDTLEHLSMEEKAKLYDDSVLASRGRPAKNNPYKG